MAQIAAVSKGRLGDVDVRVWGPTRHRTVVALRFDTVDGRVKRLLKARRMSYDGLARATGLPKQTVLVGPKLPGVTAHTLAKIADALGVSMQFLWAGKGCDCGAS